MEENNKKNEIEDKKLSISKSYKNKEEDNKVMNEEPKKTWRFGIKNNKQGQRRKNRIRKGKGNKYYK